MNSFGSTRDLSPIKVTLIYLLFGCLWILLTDRALVFFFEDRELIQQWQTSKGILFIFASSLVVYSSIRYENKRLRKTEAKLFRMENKAKEWVVKASEEERNRVSSDLHDGIQQELAALSMMLEQVKESPEERERLIEEMKKSIQGTIDEVRNISHNISSYRLEQMGLRRAVEELHAVNRNGEAVRFEKELDVLEKKPVSYFTAINLYRITQELIQNLSKHSMSTHVELSIRKQGRHFIYRFWEMESEGGKEEKGFGERSIERRIECLNGRVLPQKGGKGKEFSFLFEDIEEWNKEEESVEEMATV